MNSDELVRSLVADLKPIRRTWSVDSRVAVWATLAVLFVCIGSYALGARPDLARKLRDPAYLAESAALLLLFVSSARNAFHLSIPGVERSPLARTVPILQLLAWALLIAHRWSPGASDPLPGAVSWMGGLPCVGRMLGLGLMPAFAIVFTLRKAAPLERAWIGFFAVLSVSALAILGTQMVCMKDEPRHLLLWHVASVLMAALAGVGTGRLFLTRSRDRSPIAMAR